MRWPRRPDTRERVARVGFALVLAMIALGVAWGHGLAVSSLLSLGLAAVAGALLAHDPARDPGSGPSHGESATGDAARRDRDPAERPSSATDDALALLARLTGASRIVAWRLDGASQTLSPAAASGTAPRLRPAAADPLAWCIENAQPLRFPEQPAWAEADVVAVPAGSARSLAVTFEGAGAAAVASGSRESPGGEGEAWPPTEAAGDRLAALMAAAALVGRMVEVDAREAAVAVDLDRLDLLLGLLRRIPDDHETGGFAHALAGVAGRLLDARGAVIASWDEDAGAGEVLAASVTHEGPEPGTRFTPENGRLGLAARSAATLHTEPQSVPLRALAGEPSDRRVSGRTVAIPLGFNGHVQAVVGAWSDGPLSSTGVALLEALGPVLTVQLHQSVDLDRFRLRATQDPLTRLPNRGALEERLDLETQRFFRYRRPLAVLMLDLDHFKQVNDSYGHAAGDAVLRAVADRLRAAIRDVDFPARVGGEEMVVLLPETMARQARDVAERIRAAVAREPVAFEGELIPVTASIGISACPECVDVPEALLESADAALYQSKAAGRDRVTVAGAERGAERASEEPARG